MGQLNPYREALKRSLGGKRRSQAGAWKRESKSPLTPLCKRGEMRMAGGEARPSIAGGAQARRRERATQRVAPTGTGQGKGRHIGPPLRVGTARRAPTIWPLTTDH